MTKINMSTYNNIIKLLKNNSDKLDTIYKKLNNLPSKNNFAQKFQRELDKYKEQIAICLNHQWNLYRTNYWKNKNSNIR